MFSKCEKYDQSSSDTTNYGSPGRNGATKIPLWSLMQYWGAQSCSGLVQVPQLLWAHGHSNIHVPSRRQISALPILSLTFFPPPLPNKNIFQLRNQSHGHHVLPYFHYWLLNILVWRFDSLKFLLSLRHAM